MATWRISPIVIGMVGVMGLSFPPGSPLDIVGHARLQAAMRQCQQQVAAQGRVSREAVLVCIQAHKGRR